MTGYSAGRSCDYSNGSGSALESKLDGESFSSGDLSTWKVMKELDDIYIDVERIIIRVIIIM